VLRRRPVDDALAQCDVLPQKGARIARQAIALAAANAAAQKGLDRSRLVVDQIWTGRGQYRKRMWVHGRGRTGVRTHRYTHLNVVIAESPAARSWAKLVRPYTQRPGKRFAPGGVGGGAGGAVEPAAARRRPAAAAMEEAPAPWPGRGPAARWSGGGGARRPSFSQRERA
jgi:large subunit ribosomal protein L22